MKNLKNLMFGIGLAGSLALGNRIYSQENKVYNDFIEFVKSKDNQEGLRAVWKEEVIYSYECADFNTTVTSKKISLTMISKDNVLEIIDRGANGLSLEEEDSYEEYKITPINNLIINEKLEEKNRSKINELYINLLKNIMHDAKYKKY